MTIEVKVPLLPESIADATVAVWHKKAGDAVSRDENIVELETDKVMLEVPCPVDGVLKEIKFEEGATVTAEQVIAVVEEGAAASDDSEEKEAKTESAPSASEEKTESVPSQQAASAPQEGGVPASPSARRAAGELDVDLSKVSGTGKGGRVTKENVMSAKSGKASAPQASTPMGTREEKRVPMTRMRTRIAERLLEVTQNTAMLTTFNEINMAPVMELRKKYKEVFEKKHGTRLGFMSFFVKAVVEALKRSPIVNASIDGNDIVYHNYFDISIAVSTDRGLVVPVLRDADQMSMAEIEIKIREYAEKARSGKLSLEEMQGGNFSITNGGVFGSLMATPLLNAPQCAILGMHKIMDRAVVENGQVVVRPMMYVALSYDHRLIDGKESVSFLVNIKELLEDPTRLILEV